MFDLEQIKGAGFEEVLRQMPAAVVIAEAPSGKILFSDREARRWTEQVLGQRVPQELGQYRDLQDSTNFQMFHPDGRPYEVEEWPLTRSIRDGEEVRGEEIVHRLADGTRQWSRYDYFPIYDDEVRIVAGVLIAHDVTDEKLSNEQLAYYARLRDNTQDAFIATDQRYMVTAWNKGAEEIYGWTAEEVLGRNVMEFTRMDLNDERLAELRLQLDETDRQRAEVVAYRKNGTPIWVELTNIALRGESRVTGYVGIHRNITGRKRLEAEQQQLVNIVQKSSDFIGICDLDWQIIFVNGAGQRLVGLNGMERIRRTRVPDYFAPEDRATVGDEMFAAVLEEGRWVGELNLRHFQTGEPIPVLWDVFRLDDPDTGEPTNFATIARDITERKRAEEELKESEERFRATFEQAAVGIAHNAPDGSWLRVNQALCDIVGYTREELLQKTFQEITHPEDLDADLEQNLSLLAGEIETYTMEKRYIRKDGSAVWVDLTVSLVREPSGEPGYFIAVVEDITERKQVEEALRESSRRIEDILESITDAFYAVDREWRFTFINERALHYMQAFKNDSELTREELLGKDVWEVFPEAVSTVFYDRYHEAVREQKVVVLEEYYPPNDV